MPDTRDSIDAEAGAADDTYHQHPVRAVPLGTPSGAQAELIRKHLVDPAILDERQPFAWRVVASNNQIDSYFTRMHESSLRNYAEDAKAGVAFMNSHRTGGVFSAAELPLGRSFDARYVHQPSDGVSRVEEDYYTFRGLNLSGLSTDQFIDGMRAGIARDVSIGFHGGWYRCSICNADMMRSLECRHWRGRSYAVKDAEGRETGEQETAFAWVLDAHQSETSAVYDGATPGCMVTKARTHADAGLLRPETARWLEQRYRIALPGVRHVWAAGSTRTDTAPDGPPIVREDAGATPDQEERTMPEGTQSSTPPAAPVGAPTILTDDVREALRQGGFPLPTEDGDGLAQSVRSLTEELGRVRQRVQELEPLATDGRSYRDDLVGEALTEGVRALGEAFSRETYEPVLKNAPLAAVKRMRDDWRAVAEKRFPGGRVTADKGDRAPEGPAGEVTPAPLPAAAFRS